MSVWLNGVVLAVASAAPPASLSLLCGR